MVSNRINKGLLYKQIVSLFYADDDLLPWFGENFIYAGGVTYL